MATSQNGGQVVQYGDPRLITTAIPGTNGATFVGGIVGADLNLIFMYMAARWNNEVERITGPGTVTGLWGHNVRSIRGQESGYSNHSSGEAVDIMAVKHPLGTRTLTGAQRVAINRISDDLQGVLRFGANYSGRPDEMHAERDGSYADVHRIADLIRSGRLPNIPKELLTTDPGATRPTIPDPQTPKDDDMITDADIDRIATAVLNKAVGRGWNGNVGDMLVSLDKRLYAVDNTTTAISRTVTAIDGHVSAIDGKIA